MYLGEVQMVILEHTHNQNEKKILHIYHNHWWQEFFHIENIGKSGQLYQ